MTKQQSSTIVQALAQDSATTTFDRPIYNEDLVLNSSRSIRSDAAKAKAEKFIKIKTPFLISAFNVRTLDAMSENYETAYLVDKYQLDVIYLQEHRISHSETLLQENLFRHTLVTS